MEITDAALLLVDTEGVFAERTRALLGTACIVEVAASIDEATDRIRRQMPDLVVLGPSYSGRGHCEAPGRIAAWAPGLPVVLCADVVTRRVLLDAVDTGFADVVPTPLTPGEAAELLRRARVRGAALPATWSTATSDLDGAITAGAVSASFVSTTVGLDRTPWSEAVSHPG